MAVAETASYLHQRALSAFALVGLALGVAFWALGASAALTVTSVVVIGVVIVATAVGMVRELASGHWGLDILAVVAMGATLAVGEYVAGLIIAVMLTGGEMLERWAARRAGRELDTLLNRAPAYAQRIDPVTGAVTQVRVDEVVVGDELLVRSSEVLPVDGVLVSERAVIDESSVTGEPVPTTFTVGDTVLSGTTNGTGTFTMRATRTAADSQYATIVQLVEEAVASRSPIVRLADRYAVPFTLVSLAIAGLAWYLSGDPVRFAEVLVVATPCPLLIAAPVAFMGGMSATARLNVIVKESGTLETLARVGAVGFDKTGTLTQGRPVVARIVPGAASEEETLRLAAAAEQYSMHVFAALVVEEAARRGLPLPAVEGAEEVATHGVRATLRDGAQVRVGKPSFVEEAVGTLERESLRGGETAVYVSLDDRVAGVIVLSDPVRPHARETVERLRAAGVGEIALVTGDVATTARAVADAVGIDTVHAEVTPQQKVELVTRMRPRPVMMVGDGINDAPVLAAADVGVAMAGRGATAASESASAVITSDDFSRVADVVEVSRGTVRVALQSIWLGIAISLVLMVVAALGHLPAVAGALLQEVVDLVAILSALRTLALHRRFQPSREVSSRSTGPGPARPAHA